MSRLEQAKPDGIFNVLFGPDLTQFVREGNTRGLFEKKAALSLLTGEPEWLLPLEDEAPEGWIVTGYPWDEIDDPRHKAFVDAYRAKLQRHAAPRLAARLHGRLHDPRHASSARARTETDAMIKALEDCPVRHGRRPRHHARASTTSPPWAPGSAKLALKGATGGMTDWTYKDGAAFMPTEAEVKAVRKE